MGNNNITNILLGLVLFGICYMIYDSNLSRDKVLMYQSSVLPRYEMTKLGVLDKVMGTVTFMSPPSESRQVTLTIYDYKKLNIHKEVNFPTDTVITHMKRIKGFTPQSSWFGSESKRPNPNLFSGDKYGG
jgi:hypothetical protein